MGSEREKSNLIVECIDFYEVHSASTSISKFFLVVLSILRLGILGSWFALLVLLTG